MTRILLTGATGFIGRSLLPALLNNNHEVLALVRPASIAKLPSHKQLTIASIDEMNTAINAFKPDMVIHGAWVGANRIERNDPEFVAQSIVLSDQLLKAAHKAGAKRWIGMGSHAEYSPNLHDDIHEDAPTEADNPYGIGKRKVCLSEQDFCARNGMEHVWIRMFTTYGKDMHAGYLIPLLLEHFQRGEWPVLNNPHATFDFLHIDDAVRGLIAVAEAPKAGGVYNLAYGKEISIADIAAHLAKHFPSLGKAPAYASDAPPSRRIADIRRFQQTFGWSPSISHEEGLKRCL